MNINIDECPSELHPLICGAKFYDSSCSPGARVVFIDKDDEYFLKSAPKGSLKREADMTRYFHGKGLSAEVLYYISCERDWLLTVKLQGDDCISAKYLEQPKRLCDLFAERLALLHAEDYGECPVQSHTDRYLAGVDKNILTGMLDERYHLGSFGLASAEEAWAVVKTQGHLLKTDTLLHGDYCLPNIIINDWRFSGFIDLGSGGVGDRHVDVYWAIWTMWYNFKTNKYRERFIDAYGRDKVDESMLRIVAAVEALG